MDYSGLINLALVTIIYSTFISPNLQKLGDIRESIANTAFPIKVEDGTNDEEIELAGVELDKRMTQYANKHSEILQFLRYFYAIIAALFLIQIGLTVHLHAYTTAGLTSILAAAIVTGLLILTLRTHMIQPWKIRSIPWLSKAGIAPVYSEHLFEPKLFINNRARNITYENVLTRISIVSKIKLLGYHYILTVESQESNRLYLISAGLMTKHVASMSLIRDNGQETCEVLLTKADLRPGKYKARLLILNAPFPGIWHAQETPISFEVQESAAPQQKYKKITLQHVPSNYQFRVTKKMHIESVIFTDSSAADSNILMLLSSKSFLRALKKTNRPFIICDTDGALDKSEIARYTSRWNILRGRAKRLFKKRRNRGTYLTLTPKVKK